MVQKNKTVKNLVSLTDAYSVFFKSKRLVLKICLMAIVFFCFVEASDAQVIWTTRTPGSIFDTSDKKTVRKKLPEPSNPVTIKDVPSLWDDPRTASQTVAKFWKLTASTCKLNKDIWVYDSKWTPDRSLSALKETLESLCEKLIGASERVENGGSPDLEELKEFIDRTDVIFNSDLWMRRDRNMEVLRRFFNERIKNYFISQILQINY